MDKQIRDEFYVIKERLNVDEKKLSDFTENMHEESQDDITTLDEMVVDLQYQVILNELGVQ